MVSSVLPLASMPDMHPPVPAAVCSFVCAERAAFVAVFDGHAGSQAAEYLQGHLLRHLMKQQELLPIDPLKALGTAVDLAEQCIIKDSKSAPARPAAPSWRCFWWMTQCSLPMWETAGRCSGGGHRHSSSPGTHKPTCLQEQERINSDHPEAEVSGDGYLYGELGVARALGSQHLKRDPSKRALVATADLTTVNLQKEDDFVVLATDGLWDKVGNSEAVQVMRRTLASTRDAGSAASALVDRAQRLCSQDNISVVTLLLHDRQFQLPQRNSMLFKRQQAALPLVPVESSTDSLHPDQQPLQPVAVPVCPTPPPR